MTATENIASPPRRLTWLVATLVDTRQESATARTLTFRVSGWSGHKPGQHVDIRLTAEDGYSAQRSYSLAAPADDELLQLTIQRIADGEVSTYLSDDMRPGDQVEVRGPIGGWFTWNPHTRAPAVLIAGGSGVVPQMCMIRARALLPADRPVFQVLYSVRTEHDTLYSDELADLSAADPNLHLTIIYTRDAPPRCARPTGRLSISDLPDREWMLAAGPQVFICGPTGFVEHAANMLVLSGISARTIRTERFGPSGA